MHKKLFAVISILVLFLVGAKAMGEQEADWQWLVRQVQSGVQNIELPNSIVCEGDEGLIAEERVTIDGKGYAIKGAIIDGGQIIFHNTSLQGVHGIDDENGGSALTVRGDNAIIIFTGSTSAVGGRSGPTGEYGGDGVSLIGNKQGLILREKTSVIGGMGYFNGGVGVRVTGCENTVLISDSAACIGKPGLGVGGAGIEAPSCATIGFSNQATSTGGGSVYTGGAGVLSTLCPTCQAQGNVKILDQSMITGGVGATGGPAVQIKRIQTDDSQNRKVALRVEGEVILVGGHGGNAGPTISASHSMVYYQGSPTLYGGDYIEQEASILAYEDCVENGAKDAVNMINGKQLRIDAYPAKDMSSIISTELRQANDRYSPTTVENGLTTRGLTNKYGAMSVERGRTGRAAINGITLRITLWNGSYEQRLDFTQLLGSDGADGMRYVIVSARSEEWLAVEGMLASFEKLQSLGFTQFAYTTGDPVYCERIVDLSKLLDAAHAEETPVKNIILGTADDCVIFIHEGSKKWDYQEELMEQIQVELEALPEEPESAQ